MPEITSLPIRQAKAGDYGLFYTPPSAPGQAASFFQSYVTPGLEQVLLNGGSSPLPDGAVVGPDGQPVPLPDGSVLVFGGTGAPTKVVGPDGSPVPLPDGSVLTLG